MHILSQHLVQLLAPWASLTLMGDEMLKQVLEDPSQPLMRNTDQGYGLEDIETYDTKTSIMDLLKQGQANDARRLDVFYDFFFGGDQRALYPDSPLTVAAFKRIHDLAKEHGMNFAASVISPLDTGGEYVKTHEQAGQTMHFQEGIIRPDGSFEIKLDYQTQWTNNKGPVPLTLHKIRVFAFDEERIEGTPYYYVNEQEIEDISPCATYSVDPASLRVSRDGYGHGDLYIHGKTTSKRTRFLAVAIYRTLEIDYFADDALPYMKSILDLHKAAGITYDGIYSDEMHIQFDWDTREHWAQTEVTTRYITDSMAKTFAGLYGQQYRDLAKYLIYFTYGHHDFLPGEEKHLPAQHVFGKTREEIVRTFLFRKHYFELLHRRVVDLCTTTKKYAEQIFGQTMQATGHSTWQESPTTDSFRPEKPGADYSRYDYTPAFAWSAAQRENISACNDHFKWNEYFRVVGTDIPEGGFLDRNYYGAAMTAGLAALNPVQIAYYCIWGAPDQVKERLAEVGQTYGHYAGYCKSYELGHSFVQGYTSRCSDLLTLCPMELNYLEERFGNWMVQYGYTDFITEEKLLQHTADIKNGRLFVRGRSYSGLVVPFAPLMSAEAIALLHRFVESGGTVLWCSVPALREEEGITAQWKSLFGIDAFCFDKRGYPAKDALIQFEGFDIPDMAILSDLFPDYVYPVVPGDARIAATLSNQVLGTVKTYPSGGKAAYMGFRVRDDQSCSTGQDVDTLFSLLQALGCYPEGSCEADSRPADRRYIYNRFPNGAVTLANHFRTFREQAWPWGFYRDEAADNAFMENITLPPHSIELQEQLICGHRISYTGQGIVTYRYDNNDGLLGFAGRDTQGICIDGTAHIFTSEPADIVWCAMTDPIRDAQVQESYVLKCSKPGRITLPFDASGLQCALCRNHTLEPIQSYPFSVSNGITQVDLDASAAGQWMVFYK